MDASSIHLYTLSSGACVYMKCISGETMFAIVEHKATNDVISVNKNGSVNVDEQTPLFHIF
jgi:hypothetical protein